MLFVCFAFFVTFCLFCMFIVCMILMFLSSISPFAFSCSELKNHTSPLRELQKPLQNTISFFRQGAQTGEPVPFSFSCSLCISLSKGLRSLSISLSVSLSPLPWALSLSGFTSLVPKVLPYSLLPDAKTHIRAGTHAKSTTLCVFACETLGPSPCQRQRGGPPGSLNKSYRIIVYSRAQSTL